MFLESPAIHQLLSEDVSATEEYLNSVKRWSMAMKVQEYPYSTGNTGSENRLLGQLGLVPVGIN